MRIWIGSLLAVLGCSSPGEWCPPETVQTGEGPPAGYEVVCKKENTTGEMVPHGPTIKWHQTGEKQSESLFVEGRQEGVERAYGPRGELVAKTPYLEGKKHGLEIGYHANQTKKFQTLYRRGRAVGETQRWHDHGLVVAKIEWVRVPGGQFRMGHPKARGNPPRTVQVDPFHLSRAEITVELYRKCHEAGRCTEPRTGPGCNWGQSDRDAHPINCVSAQQADGFARWAEARLPTEVEWEYAARSGGKVQTYPWGNAPATCTHAVFDEGDDGCGQNRTWRACSKARGHSTQGICDLAGNIAEWVATTTGAHKRIFRGGSWTSMAKQLRVFEQRAAKPIRQPALLGFRVARDVSQPSK